MCTSLPFTTYPIMILAFVFLSEEAGIFGSLNPTATQPVPGAPMTQSRFVPTTFHLKVNAVPKNWPTRACSLYVDTVCVGIKYGGSTHAVKKQVKYRNIAAYKKTDLFMRSLLVFIFPGAPALFVYLFFFDHDAAMSL